MKISKMANFFPPSQVNNANKNILHCLFMMEGYKRHFRAKNSTQKWITDSAGNPAISCSTLHSKDKPFFELHYAINFQRKMWVITPPTKKSPLSCKQVFYWGMHDPGKTTGWTRWVWGREGSIVIHVAFSKLNLRLYYSICIPCYFNHE